MYKINIVYYNKYHRSVKPLVTDEEFRITEEIVHKFGAQNGLGEKLQSSLEERAKNTENWVCAAL